jgi:hypothetical protein
MKWIVLVGLVVLALSLASEAQAIDWKDGIDCTATTVAKAFPPKDGHVSWCPSDGANSPQIEIGTPGMLFTWKGASVTLDVYRCTGRTIGTCVGHHTVPAATSCAGGTTPCSSFFLPPGLYIIDPSGSTTDQLTGNRSN